MNILMFKLNKFGFLTEARWVQCQASCNNNSQQHVYLIIPQQP